MSSPPASGAGHLGARPGAASEPPAPPHRERSVDLVLRLVLELVRDVDARVREAEPARLPRQPVAQRADERLLVDVVAVLEGVAVEEDVVQDQPPLDAGE